MGKRTVVMLDNDQAHKWRNDPELGRKIMYATTSANRQPQSDEARVDGYGQVVQCCDTHSETLVLLSDTTTLRHVAGKFWNRDETSDQVLERLLRDAAEKLGYQLVKKTKKAPKS